MSPTRQFVGGLALPLYANCIDLARLKRLTKRVYSGSHRERADWLELYYRSGAWRDIGSDELHDRYGITERTRDSCGEMGDCEAVIADVMRRVDADPKLGTAITAAEGSGTLDRWRELASKAAQASLF
jgi:hypothetical protein